MTAFKQKVWMPLWKQVSVQPRVSAVNITLPAFVAGRRCRRCRSISPARTALSSKPAARRGCCRLTGQTDRQTDGLREVRPCHVTQHTLRTVALTEKNNINEGDYLWHFVYTPVQSVNYCDGLGRCFRFVCIYACAAVFLCCCRIFRNKDSYKYTALFHHKM